MPERLRKWALPTGALVLLTAGLAWVFRPQPVPVDIATVERGPMMVTIDEEGETRIKEVYVVAAPLTGRLRRISQHVGDEVAASQTVLSYIEPADPAFHDLRARSGLEAALKAAEAAHELAAAEVKRLEASHDFAVTELRRTRELAARGTVSASALDRAEMESRTQAAALETARAALKVREYEVQTARAALIDPVSAQLEAGGELCCFPVVAPVSGHILRLHQESETVVIAGEPLVEIGDSSDLEIVVDLLSSDAVRISPGDPVLIEQWGGEQTLHGRVRRVEPFGFTKISALGIEEQRVNVIIDIEDQPELWRRLGHGYRVETRIVTWSADDVPQVPIGSLFRAGGAWALFRLEDGRARLTKVQIGHMNQHSAEIVAGIEPMQRLVLHPGDRIVDGVRVVPRELE